MRKVSMAVVFLAAALVPSARAYGWGSATHAFIGHEMRAQAGPVDLDEVYGSMAPDLFNFLFATDYAPFSTYLYGLSHDGGGEVRAAVLTGEENALVYGFLGHNDQWGSDRTAHHASLTLEPNVGYVVTKALALRDILSQIPQYAALGLAPEASLEVCHNLVESAGDLIIAGAEPRVGAWMAAAAARPAEPLQGLLARAWTSGLVDYAATLGVALSAEEAAGLIVGSESWFRARLASQGALLQQDSAAAFEGAVLDFAALATAYLASLGVELPEGTDLSPLIGFGLSQALSLCSEDYLAETRATVAATSRELRVPAAVRLAR